MGYDKVNNELLNIYILKLFLVWNFLLLKKEIIEIKLKNALDSVIIYMHAW
jgi:hypothetical protein